ncbi:hypothetical protein PANT111_10211 [Pantoea brenneri]|uniref:Integrase n=1 Tax=Pantoea brenneri TaxID=472694 RepID=A0AAX3IZW0_9GAMM|nr:hypothetical protein PANT111_10211 [Pantoea brenneri]
MLLAAGISTRMAAEAELWRYQADKCDETNTNNKDHHVLHHYIRHCFPPQLAEAYTLRSNPHLP